MQSKARNVNAYVAEVPRERRAALKELRVLCARSLKSYKESMEYGMPVYKRGDGVEVAFASQKQYISLYVLRQDVLDRHRKALLGCTIGKGCIRYSNPAKIDFECIAALLRDLAQSKSEAC